MTPFADIQSPTIKLLEDDIDTDQMIPARFLRTSESKGLGAFLFHDRRYAASGLENPDFALSSSRYSGELILVAGRNFGCGSSREHAPWALKDFGIKAIIAESFADIFYNNCLMNGILPIVVNASIHKALSRESSPLTISLKNQNICYRDQIIPFVIDPFSRFCLMHGISELDFIIQNEKAIQQFESISRERIRSLAIG